MNTTTTAADTPSESMLDNNSTTDNRNVTESEPNNIGSEQSNDAPLYKIVLTGGPCGGKTTSLARLSSYLRERGFEIMTCPEAFSVLIHNGMSMNYYAQVEGIASVIQSSVMEMQLALEDSMAAILQATGRPSVLLCDRGLMDGSAYCSSDQWTQILHKQGIGCSCEIREGRYNAVFHLVTAAEGAENYYTLENNAVRSETPEMARQLDQMTRAAWVGHPKLVVFDNSTNFEGKLQRLVNATAKLVGLPSSLARSSVKFLLHQKPQLHLFPPDVKYHVFEVEKVYIYDDRHRSKATQDSQYVEEYSFIRKRTQGGVDGGATGGGEVYGQTIVKRTKDGQEIEIKRIISNREYTNLYKARDMSRNVVRQTRVSFIWNMQSFNVHIYSEPVKVRDLCVLHCQFEEELSSVNDIPREEIPFELPPFLDIGRRILPTTEDSKRYGAYSISLIDGSDED